MFGRKKKKDKEKGTAFIVLSCPIYLFYFSNFHSCQALDCSDNRRYSPSFLSLTFVSGFLGLKPPPTPQTPVSPPVQAQPANQSPYRVNSMPQQATNPYGTQNMGMQPMPQQQGFPAQYSNQYPNPNPYMTQQNPYVYPQGSPYSTGGYSAAQAMPIKATNTLPAVNDYRGRAGSSPSSYSPGLAAAYGQTNTNMNNIPQNQLSALQSNTPPPRPQGAPPPRPQAPPSGAVVGGTAAPAQNWRFPIDAQGAKFRVFSHSFSWLS